MLKKDNRLKKKKDFENVFKKGKGYKESFLSVKVSPNNLKENRFGIVISQKVSKKAVVRNKIKRKIKAVILKNLDILENGFDCIFIVRPQKTPIDDYQKIEKEVERLLKAAKLIND